MGEVACGWAACGSGAEATLDGRSLCRDHFYHVAARGVEEHRARLQRIEPTGADRIELLKFMSELISQTTTFVAHAKFLGPGQRDQFLQLTLSAVELYRRVQRNPRVPRNMPVLIYRETDSDGKEELTNTVDVGKRGACIHNRDPVNGEGWPTVCGFVSCKRWVTPLRICSIDLVPRQPELGSRFSQAIVSGCSRAI
jgi:hypothetical protein